MAKLTWDGVGERFYETGVSKGVLYPMDAAGAYPLGVAWNGLTAINESPSGAEATPFFADNIKYLSLVGAEQFGATIEAYTYPDEFAQCDGSVEAVLGAQIGQQSRGRFGLVYVTVLGNDVEGNELGYKIHIIYGAQAAPSEKGYSTINDSPEAVTFSWEITTTPAPVTGHKPTATMVIDSTKATPAKLALLEAELFGDVATPANLPTPDEIITLLTGV